jgi:prefoldin subunit 5
MKSIEELKAEFEELENEENEVDKMLQEVHGTKDRFRR